MGNLLLREPIYILILAFLFIILSAIMYSIKVENYEPLFLWKHFAFGSLALVCIALFGFILYFFFDTQKIKATLEDGTEMTEMTGIKVTEGGEIKSN